MWVQGVLFMQTVTVLKVPAFVFSFGQRWILLTVVILFALGCGSGDGLNRQPISGAVTVDDVPVPNGSVTFEPLFAVALVVVL